MQEGFLAPRRRNPTGFAAIVAIHVGVIAILATSVAHLHQPRRDPTVLVENVPDPPPQLQQKTAPIQHPATHIEYVPPLVHTTVATPHIADVQPQPDPVEDGAEIGNDTSVIQSRTQPPAHNPVLVEAGLDSRFAADLQPPYPTALERAGTEGAATVRVLIGTDGRVHQVEQIAADDPEFFAATERQALHRWRFRPATRDGGAVESWKTLTVRFRIQAG